jgi:hypothetical protein
MGRLEETIAAVLLYWLHSFPLACLIFSHNSHWALISEHLCNNDRVSHSN